eukprot:2601494-Amphidinium_carterae.2
MPFVRTHVIDHREMSKVLVWQKRGAIPRTNVTMCSQCAIVTNINAQQLQTCKSATQTDSDEKKFEFITSNVVSEIVHVPGC